MSYFGDELSAQLSAKNVAAMTLAERTGISASQISKWTTGKQTVISEQQLAVIQAALGDDPRGHARLVLAHLLDEKFGLSHELVDVRLHDDGALRDEPRRQSKGEAAIAFLSKERVKNPDLNEMLIDLARLLRPKGE